MAVTDSLWPVVSRTWNGERQRDSRTIIRYCPEASAMALDDGSTDRQADPPAVGLCRVECFEEPLPLNRVEPHPNILHAQPHVIVFASGGPDHHASWSIIDAVHRLGRVPEKVQDDLLKLHTIARNGREVVGQLHPNVYLASLQLAR